MSTNDDESRKGSSPHRKDDADDSVHFRSHRIHCINDGWYYLTRESGNVGPCATREEAEAHLSEFLKRARSSDNDS